MDDETNAQYGTRAGSLVSKILELGGKNDDMALNLDCLAGSGSGLLLHTFHPAGIMLPRV